MTAPDSNIKTPLPRSSRARRVPARMTLREFATFDADPDQRWELIEGAPALTVPQTGPHNNLAGDLVHFVGTVLTDAAGWYAVYDTSVRLTAAESEVRPDVAAYRKDDLKDPGLLPFRSVPALVIECLSPSTAARDMDTKRVLYHKVGVAEYWVVDPKTGAISLFVHKKAGYEQLSVDPKGFIKSPLLKKSLRIVVKRWTFEILEA